MTKSIDAGLSQAYLKGLLSYNKKNGEWRWKYRKDCTVQVNARFAGKPAGSYKAGYLIICIDGRPYRAHVLAWLYVKGVWPDSTIDHKNRNRSDCRWSNLRKATYSQQKHNEKLRKDNTSGHVGVRYISRLRKWTASLTVKGVRSRGYLGLFSSRRMAIAARKEAERKYLGKFGRETRLANG